MDAQLLTQIVQADEEAFSELYRRYGAQLLSYLQHMVREQPAAEDLLQEVFVAVWQGASQFRGDAQVKTWLFHIAHNRAVSWLRRHHKQVALEDVELTPGAGDLESITFDPWQGQQLRQALDQLSPLHREVIELAFVYDMPYQEISLVIGCPVGTVKSRVSHAKRKLSSLLQGLVEKDV